MRLLQKCNSKKCYPQLVSDTSRGPSLARHLTTSRWTSQNETSQSSENLNKNAAGRNKDRQTERDLLVSILSASTTKRDAKSYLSRFTPTEANKGPTDQKAAASNQLHVALVKIRQPQSLDDPTLIGIAQTLSHLGRLGLVSIVVLDCAGESPAEDGAHSSSLRNTYMNQADRLVSAIQNDSQFKARRLDFILGVTPAPDNPSNNAPSRGSVGVEYDDILSRTLSAGIIPILSPIAYSTDSQKRTDVRSDEVLLALTRQFVRLPSTETRQYHAQTQPFDASVGNTDRSRQTVSVDRIIILDPLGGLPSGSRPDKAHIFINLEQEYRGIRQELVTTIKPVTGQTLRSNTAPSLLSNSSPISQTLEEEAAPVMYTGTSDKDTPPSATALERHVENLDLLHKTLRLLPPSSSALLTSPAEAATLSPSEKVASGDIGVGTRRPGNPLIHNLLTDKPLISSSLPVSRLQADGSHEPKQVGRATFVKRGMSLTMIPDPRQETWEPPSVSRPSISLDDPRIDFPRLLNLIEDSFNRRLDVKHFLGRIENKVAGVIVAGEYEGGAILTWELPPGVPDDGSEASRARMVPYLDKFAVLKRSQGSGGVADIVFSAMVRTCFPQGVCWRSRKSNPVNKWYFERSLGTFKLPDSNWSMFWTTPGLLKDKQRFLDYAGVCRAVKPSWTD